MQRGVICREAQVNNCEKESTCTGLYDGCPKSLPVADGTFCQEKGTCKSGVCVPFCETKGLQSCMCDNSKFRSILTYLSLFAYQPIRTETLIFYCS